MHVACSRNGATWNFYKNGEVNGTGNNSASVPDIAASVKIGSVTGAAIGALFIGLARTIAIFYAPQLELFIVFFVMAIILSFKPEGLFGSKEVRKI